MIRKTFRSAAGPYLILGLTALCMLFFRIGSLPFLGNDECRYARIAEEMNQAGRWVTPLLQGYPWLEKPPLYYWMTILVYRITGVSEASARYGPAVCAVLAAAAIVWLGTRLWSRRAGWTSGLILITATGYCAFGRSATPDMPLMACLTVAFTLMAAALVKDEAARWWLWTAYALLGLAVLAKGPVAFALAVGILMLFWTLDEQGGCLKKLHVVWGAAIACAVALPWHWLAFKENGFSFVASFLINHNFARYVTDVHHHDEPIFYFLPVLLGLLFPWSGWLPALAGSHLRLQSFDMRKWDRSVLFLACWALFPLLFFSLSSSKLPGYVLPCLPPLALLLGRGLTQRSETSTKLKGTPWVLLGISLGLAIALPVGLRLAYRDAWHAGLILGGVVALPALVVFALARRGNLRGAVHATAVQGVIFLLAVTQFGFAPLAEYNSAHEIAGKALAVSTGKVPIVTFSYFDYTLYYYTGYRIDANITDPHSLLAYAQKQPEFLVVTTDQLARELEKMPELSVRRLAEQGKLRLLRSHVLPR